MINALVKGISSGMEVILAEKMQVPSTLNGVQNEHLNITNRNKPSIKLQKALDWIAMNDSQFQYTVREAATLAGVSIGTMHKAREMIK